jgi:hypothetical protein
MPLPSRANAHARLAARLAAGERLWQWLLAPLDEDERERATAVLSGGRTRAKRSRRSRQDFGGEHEEEPAT